MPQQHHFEALKPQFKLMVDLNDFENSETQAMVAAALENPKKFVLKPMKEGGGNNIFGEELR